MPTYDTRLKFKDKDGNSYEMLKSLKSTTGYERERERQSYIQKEVAKGNKYCGGGSVQQHNK